MGIPHADHEPTKTLGPQAARLVTSLHERGRPLFTHADVAEITGLFAKSARNLVAGLVNRGLATRLKPGLFILVPFELGREREYLGNPYVVARELADTPEYYLSHASAMDLHRMVTQPQFAVFVTSPKAIRPRTVLGTEFRFVRCKREDVFGIAELWATKTERVRVSDLERTVIDGLKQPEHCGGLTEVAKGFWMRRDAIAVPKLVDYALRLGVGAVVHQQGSAAHGCSAASDSGGPRTVPSARSCWRRSTAPARPETAAPLRWHLRGEQARPQCGVGAPIAERRERLARGAPRLGPAGVSEHVC